MRRIFLITTVIFVIALGGCASSSGGGGAQGSAPKGAKVWNPKTAEFYAEESIPEDKQAQILFTYYNSTLAGITSYDGKAVDWKRDSGYGAARVVLPVGKHRISYKYADESRAEWDLDWEGDFEFKAGHRYRPTYIGYWFTFVDITDVPPVGRAVIKVTASTGIRGNGFWWGKIGTQKRVKCFSFPASPTPMSPPRNSPGHRTLTLRIF
jgi:hypothetical protein